MMEVKQTPAVILLDGNAQRLFWGQLISQACDKLMTVGMIWVITANFSAQWIPWFIALGALPHFLLAAHSGKWITRWGALRTVIGADLFRGALFIFASWLAWQLTGGTGTYDAHTAHALLFFLCTAVFVQNIASSLFNPAILSLPVALMEEGERRDKLTALIDSCFAFGNVIGPLVAAVTYSAYGLVGMLAINGLSYFFSAILALGIKEHAETRAHPGTGTVDGASSAGAAYDAAPARSMLDVRKCQPVIAGMLLTFLLMNFFLAPLMLFMPWYAKNIYADGINGFARLEAFMGIGTVLGSVLLSFKQIPGATWKRVAFSLALMATSYLAFTFSHTLFYGCLAVSLLGFFLSMANVFILTFFQSASRAEDVPTVMGLVNLISVASLPISMAVVGAFIDKVQVQPFAAACAAIVVAIALSIRLIPGIAKV